MSDTKWTPGPWVASHRVTTSSVKSLVYKSHKGPILVCSIPSAATGDREHTAHLIAAAPELYSVLETAVMQGDRILNGDPPAEGEDFDGWFLAAKAALAKAQGEQS